MLTPRRILGIGFVMVGVSVAARLPLPTLIVGTLFVIVGAILYGKA